jgi:hypothetical protein
MVTSSGSPGARRSEKLGVTNIAAEQLAQPDAGTMLSEASPIQRSTIWQTVAQEMSKYADEHGVLRIPTESLCVVGRA